VEETWFSRELPVLQAIVWRFDDPFATPMDVGHIVDEVGLETDDVHRALVALWKARPPFLEGVEVDQVPYPVQVTGVTERALREIGKWPNADVIAERIVAALNAAADREPDEEKRSRLRRAADAVGGLGKELFVEITAAVITKQMPGLPGGE
jgi:hypothetical protein